MNLLGAGFGTTSVKAVLFDEKLNQLAESTEDYTVKTSGNIVELEAEKYWKLLKNAITASTEAMRFFHGAPRQVWHSNGLRKHSLVRFPSASLTKWLEKYR